MEAENHPKIQQQNAPSDNSTLNDGLQNDLSAPKHDNSTLRDESRAVSSGLTERCVSVFREVDKNKPELEVTKGNSTLNYDIKDLSKGGKRDLNPSKPDAVHDPASKDQMTPESRENEQDKESDLQISQHFVQKDVKHFVQSDKTSTHLSSSFSSAVTTPSSAVTTPSSAVTTPSSAVTTPSSAVTTPSSAVTTPSSEQVSHLDEVVDPPGAQKIEKQYAECASVNQKQIPPTPDMTSPGPSTRTPPTLDQTTPTTSLTAPTLSATAVVPFSIQTTASDAESPFELATPTSEQTTPTSEQTTPTSEQTTPTSEQTTPTSEQTTSTSEQATPSSEQAPPSSEQTTPTSEQATPSSSAPSPAPCLRGYLLKRGGALKAWKQRWFVFAEETNALVYYRTQRDVTPLGQVCLSYASFTCEGAEPGVFYLHTPERTVTLKAQSDQLKFYWLQQLQLQRWIRTPTKDLTEAELFPQLQSAEEVNTEEAASQPLLLQLSLKHPFIELQNSLKKRPSSEVSQSVFHVPTPPPTPPTTSSANHSAGKAPATGSKAAEANQKEDRSVRLSKEWTMRQDSTATKRKSFSGRIQATPTPSQATPTNPQTTPTLSHVTLRRRSRSFLRRNTSSWTERSRLQQELQDQRDLVGVLQQALELCQSEKWSSRLDQQDRNQTEEEQDLRRRLLETQVQLEDLQTSLDQKDQIIRELKKEVRELSEKNKTKQQVIEKLYLSVTQWTEQSSDVDLQSIQTLVQQNQNLQDDLRCFRNQNYFLNSEIHHLSGLWRTSTEGQRVLMNKASVQREQHLRLLRELQELSLRDGPQGEALRRLLQDALNQEQTQEPGPVQVNREWDLYGFPLVQHFEVEDIKLLVKIQAPDLRTQQNQEATERPLVARWEQYMSSCRGNLSASPELKSLIRTGIPSHFRPQVWNWIIRTRTQRDQDPLQYQQVCEQMESTSQSRPWSRQIDLDLPRTLCTNHNFSSPSSPALQQLRRILLAFSWENPSVGYCQGLNRIAGLLLLVLGSEEDTFWGLKAVVENLMPPDYFTPSLVASQADQLVLKDFLGEKLPRLASHLDKCGVDVSSSTFTWFLVVFVEVLPSHVLLPLWDAFLYEGSKVLFRFSLAMFKMKEAEILQLSTNLELYQYFRVLPKTVLDYRRLSVVAFDELNPFSRRAVRSRRRLHLERLQRELCELRRQQKLFLSQRSVRRNSDGEEAAEEAKDEEEEEFDNNSEDEDVTVSCI